MPSKGTRHRHTRKHDLRNKARSDSRTGGLTIIEAWTKLREQAAVPQAES